MASNDDKRRDLEQSLKDIGNKIDFLSKELLGRRRGEPGTTPSEIISSMLERSALEKFEVESQLKELCSPIPVETSPNVSGAPNSGSADENPEQEAEDNSDDSSVSGDEDTKDDSEARPARRSRKKMRIR